MRLTDFIFSCYNTGVFTVLFFGGSHIYAGSLLNSILFPYDRVKQAPIFAAFHARCSRRRRVSISPSFAIALLAISSNNATGEENIAHREASTRWCLRGMEKCAAIEVSGMNR